MASTRLIFLLIGFCAVLSVNAQLSSRIWGGVEAGKESFPHAASVRLDNAHICGGSIIGSKHILTAAHCVKQGNEVVSTKRLAVRVGSVNQFSGGKLVYISAIIIHPNYAGVKNDIAILILENDLTYTERIKNIQLATSSADIPAAGTSVAVAGWGAQSESESAYKLNYVSFRVASDGVCIDAYSDSDDSTICLAHDLKQGSCTGDAGNGAVYNGKLVGVSNFVVGACGSRYPDVFGNVAHFAAWIQSVIA